MSNGQVMLRHVLRNSLIPVVTYLGQDIGALMGGAMITEQIFNPPVKQQGPGSQGWPSPALRYGERGDGGENGLCCFLVPRHVGAVVCYPRRLSLCRMQLPEARFGRSV